MQLFSTEELLASEAVPITRASAAPAGRKQERDKKELSREGTNSLFFSDAAMIGIVCALPGPRFCWTLNQHFHTSFSNNPDDAVEMVVDKDGKVMRNKKNKPLHVDAGPSLFSLNGAEREETVTESSKGEHYFFPVYCYGIPNSSFRYLVYKLKSGLVSLLADKKLRRYDYLWLVQTADAEHDAHLVLDILRLIPAMQVVQQLDAEEMEHCKEYLVL